MPQRSFPWDLHRWRPVVADLAVVLAVLEGLPNRLGRDEVRVVVQEQLAVRQPLAALVPVLIWGGPGGYGPHRARAILTGDRTRSNLDRPVDESIGDRLAEAAGMVRHGKLVDAFRYLNNQGHVRNLGGAFFTKWMAYASMTASTYGAEVAPILDKRVRDWIARASRDTGRPIELRTDRTSDYETYLTVLDVWGHGPGRTRTRAQVELAIFELAI